METPRDREPNLESDFGGMKRVTKWSELITEIGRLGVGGGGWRREGALLAWLVSN